MRFYAPAHQLVPNWLDEILFASGPVTAIVALVIGAALASRDDTDRSSWVRAVAIVVISGLGSLIMWHANGEEAARHTIETDIMARLGILLAFGALAGKYPGDVTQPETSSEMVEVRPQT